MTSLFGSSSGINFKFEVFGEEQINRDLLRVKSGLTSAKPAFQALMTYFENIEEKQFGSEGKFGSGGWAPLKPATIAAKERADLDPRILHATLALRDSLTFTKHEAGIRTAEPLFMIFGTSVPYAEFHQKGTKTLPQRKIIDLSKTARRNTVKIIQRFILTGSVGEI